MSAREKYKDIIDLPHFVSKNRKHMSNHDRAAQFAPFAALTGYEAAIDEKSRLTEDRIELSENDLNMLNKKINILKDHKEENNEIILTIFIPDRTKNGGSYEDINIKFRMVDDINKVIVDEKKNYYPLDYILDINGEIIDRYYI